MFKELLKKMSYFATYLRSHPILFCVVIGITLLLNWGLVYHTDGTSNIFTNLFYFSIILAAYGFGKMGGLITGAITGILLGPFMPFSVAQHISQVSINWEFRLLLFLAFGYIIGFLFDRLRKQKDQLHELNSEIISALSMTIEARDAYTKGHCSNVKNLAVKLGKELKLPKHQLNDIKWASLLHDIGKIAIPEDILNKPGKLTNEEYEVIQTHPTEGAKIIEPIKELAPILPGIKYHHESLDGTGYPYGLSEHEIPLQAKIIAVADIWDALTSDRPYRKGMSYLQAANIMNEMAGQKLDSQLVSLFLKNVVKVEK